MKILGIETSCDETALCILEAEGDTLSPRFNVLGTSLFSQIDIHKEYGGVFPMLAKREHGKNLIPLFEKLLSDTEMLEKTAAHESKKKEIEELLVKEPELREHFFSFISAIKKPDIDAIAVTTGPGLEPALWVGINFARALHAMWGIPVIPVNHMEGHILSPLLQENTQNKPVEFPALALLISGGHTELVLIKEWGTYQILGSTRDDAVGEAFDKVARMLSLPYPGGPHISKLAEESRTHKTSTPPFKLPRPMLNSDNYDFSFSGLKTAVLYGLKEKGELTQEETQGLAQEFEDAITDVLIAKTFRALDEFGARTLIIGGGVVANSFIRKTFEEKLREHPEVTLLVPTINLATDNAVMIAMAGYFNFKIGTKNNSTFKASGNLKLEQKP